jgi:hypothetical protein
MMMMNSSLVSSSSSVESRDDVLFKSLRKYYEEPGRLRVLTDIIRGETDVSLRTLDWLVTNYSKKHNTVYTHEGKMINMFLEYKACLKAFSKKYFDPFQRRARIKILDADGKDLQSTVGQLNFFKFAISKGVIDYALAHAADIEADMIQAIKHRLGKTHGKRRELSRAAVKTATATDIKVTVRFV